MLLLMLWFFCVWVSISSAQKFLLSGSAQPRLTEKRCYNNVALWLCCQCWCFILTMHIIKHTYNVYIYQHKLLTYKYIYILYKCMYLYRKHAAKVACYTDFLFLLIIIITFFVFLLFFYFLFWFGLLFSFLYVFFIWFAIFWHFSSSP